VDEEENGIMKEKRDEKGEYFRCSAITFQIDFLIITVGYGAL
jgi:hypothetical protein